MIIQACTVRWMRATSPVHSWGLYPPNPNPFSPNPISPPLHTYVMYVYTPKPYIPKPYIPVNPKSLNRKPLIGGKALNPETHGIPHPPLPRCPARLKSGCSKLVGSCRAPCARRVWGFGCRVWGLRIERGFGL